MFVCRFFTVVVFLYDFGFPERHTISQATVFQNTRFCVETEYSETVRLPYGTTIGAVSMAFCFVWLLGLPDHTNKTLC